MNQNLDEVQEVEKSVTRGVAESSEALSKWFAARMPEREGLHVEGLEVPQATGFSSETLMFDLVWTENGTEKHERAVARLNPHGDFLSFPHYDIKMQFDIMSSLAATDVPVPPMLGYEADESILGDEFYVMDFVDGVIPTDQPPYHTAGWVPELTSAQRTELWFNGVEAMAKVHNLDYKALGIDFLPTAAAGESQIQSHLKVWDYFMEWALEGAEHPVCARAQKWLHANMPTGEEDERIIWGDSRLANQIFKDQKVTAVIDWEMARIASPVEDLAWWILMDRCFSEGLGVERLEGLPDREATIARWVELTGLEPRNLEYYELWAAFRFTLLIYRVGMGMHHKGILPADNDFQLNNFASGLLAKMLDEMT